MTPQPATAIHLTLDPATIDASLATIFDALRRDPEGTAAQHQSQRDTGAMMIAALRPDNPVEAAYAVRATAAHFATMECFRRTTLPDTPDSIGLRWCGKALALSRMATDMIRTLEMRQAAAPHTQQQPLVRPEDRVSLAAEVARRQAAARSKSAETQASPRASDRRDPMSSERPSVPPAAPAVAIRPAAAVVATPFDRQVRHPPLEPRAVLSPHDPRGPMSSERTWLTPAASANMTTAAAVPLRASTVPRPGLRARLLKSTGLFSSIFSVPAAPAVTPAKPAGA